LRIGLRAIRACPVRIARCSRLFGDHYATGDGYRRGTVSADLCSGRLVGAAESPSVESRSNARLRKQKFEAGLLGSGGVRPLALQSVGWSRGDSSSGSSTRS